MSDDLTLPQVPEPKPDDPEDVSWALSTAEAMWARGDHSEGIKWVRRAAEAASEAENDERALELAKVAADLTGLVARRTSRASIDIEEVDPMSENLPAAAPPPPVPRAKAQPPKVMPGSVTKQVTTPSRPPAPLPSRTSQPPPALGGKPLGTNTSPGMGAGLGLGAQKTPSVAPGPISKRDPAKKARRSRENLEVEAGAMVRAPDTSPDPLQANDTSETAAVTPREVGNNDPTFVGHVRDLKKSDRDDRTADEWDASPTQNLTGDDMGFPFPPRVDARMTAVALPPSNLKSTQQGFARPKPIPAAGSPPPSAGAPSAGRATATEPHDPGIVTSQAVRVVVWRDGNGVHVAPAGTVVSAITVDAMLVALEPNADLTAWLTQKGR